jgi:hypothetical protein
MWTVIETSMAVIIGCAPAFAAIIHKLFGSLAVSYDSRGYIRRPDDEVEMAPSDRTASEGGEKGEKSSSSDGRAKRGGDDLWATETQGSEDAPAVEEAAPRPKKHKGTRVRR